MLYSAKHNFLYIKTKKTASSTAECALEYLIRGEMHAKPTNCILYPDGSRIGYRGNNPEDDPNHGSSAFFRSHMSAEEIKKLVGSEIFKKSIKISSIRNPYSMCISAFHHFGNQPVERHQRAKENSYPNFTKEKFENFMLTQEKKITKGFSDRHFCLQGSFIVDMLIRQEFFKDDLRMVLEKLKIPSETSEYILNNFLSMKVSKRKNSALEPVDYYTDKSFEIVNNIYANWFKWGNYQKASELGGLRSV